VESILIAATALPFAGDAETGISVGAFVRKVIQPSGPTSHRRPRGARPVTEEGNPPYLSRLVREKGGVPSLPSGRPTPRTSPSLPPCSVQPSAESGRRFAGGVTSERWPRRPTYRQACTCSADGGEGAAWLARPPFPGRGEAHAHRARRKTDAESEGRSRGTGGNALRPSRSEDRALEVMLARRHRSRSRSRETVSDAEKWTLSLHPMLKAFRDGRLARGPTHESAPPRVKGHRHPLRSGNLT